jgi:signal peptidase I
VTPPDDQADPPATDGPASDVDVAPEPDAADADPTVGSTDAPTEQDEDDEEDEETTSARRVRSAIEWVAVVVGAVVVALLVRTFLFTTFWIPSGSMEPTLSGERRDRVIVNRLSYKLHDVNRGDIIVFEVPEGEPLMQVDGQQVKDLIKRVVGLPGETVELRDGEVYVDGEQLEEPYLPEDTTTEPCPPENETTFEVPDDSVFVMGDNRDHSRDARCWTTHSVEESAIVGRAFVRFWPLSELGGI